MHNEYTANGNQQVHPGWPLQRTLTLWFCCAVAIACLAVGALTYYLRSQGLRRTILEELSMVRDDKVRDIQEWIAERRNDLALWSEAPGLVRIADAHAAGEPISDRQAFLRQLERMRQAYHCHALGVFDPMTGRAIAETGPAGHDKLMPAILDRVLREKTVLHTDVVICPKHEIPTLVFAAPMLSEREPGRIVGVLVFYVDLQGHFFEQVLHSEQLGETGEILLLNRDGVAQSPLRLVANAPARHTVSAAGPARNAAAGMTGSLIAEDYGGVWVMAAYGFMPEVGWGIVAKKNYLETTAVVRNMARDVTLVSIAALLLASSLGWYAARRIAAPAAGIAATAEKIHTGDMSTRAQPQGPLELRKVAHSFNSLMDQLMRRLQTGERLSSIFAAASAHNRLGSLLDEVLPKIMEATRSQSSAFYLAAGGNGVLRRTVVHGAPGETMADRIHTRSPDHLLGQAAAKGKVEVISGLSDQHDLRIATQSGTTRPAALMSVPLMHLGKPLGVLGLASLYEYRPEDIEVAQTLSLSLGQSIAAALASEENWRISEELRVNNEELTSANEELQSQTEELQQQSEELHQQTEELQQQAAELAHQRAQVEEADRLKSQFLSNMSHELRTPLNSIMALSQLMLVRGTGTTPDKEAEYLKIIERNGRHLLNLINDILDLSKIESGRMDVSLSTFQPEEVVQRALEVARPLAEAKGLAMNVEIPQVPEITTDKDKVHQILLNLLSNAVKFTDKGQIDVRISAADDKVRFAVQDTGIGISEADLADVFDEFRQADGSTTRRHEGTGLGLSIGQKLARMLGGQITFETEEGQGSTFTLTLPIRSSASTDRGAVTSRRRTARPKSQARNILVVDDDPSVRNLLQTYLTESGYNVLLAANGQEALTMARSHSLHAITLDVLMPDMDGWEVIRELKADTRTASVPILVISVTEDRATALALGASGFLTKPVDRHILLGELERIARSRPVHRILVVDDDGPTRQQLKLMLEDKYEQVHTAAGGDEALRIVRELPPDAIVLDLMMPDMDGFTVLEHLRSDPATYNIPVLILTAKDLTTQDRERLRQAVSRIVTKGTMDRDRLLRELDRTLAELDERPVVSPPRRSNRILIVDDDEIAAIQISSALEDAGYETIVASGGAQALASTREAVPDAVVLDVMMPGMDGFEVLRQLRSSTATAEVPVLILTAKELTASEKERLADDHVRQLIQKGSVDRDRLVEVVRELLQHPSGAQENEESGVAANDGEGVILVVEDNPDNLTTIAAVLDDCGRKHVHASDGEQAVRMVREIEPALVLMDMQLPVLSGMDAVRQIKSDRRLARIPIVALTAKVMRGDRERILAAGCDDYLPKPLARSELLRILDKWAS